MKKLILGLLLAVPCAVFAEDTYQEDVSPVPPAPRVGEPIDKRVPPRSVRVNAEVVELDMVEKRLDAKMEANPRMKDRGSRMAEAVKEAASAFASRSENVEMLAAVCPMDVHGLFCAPDRSTRKPTSLFELSCQLRSILVEDTACPVNPLAADGDGGALKEKVLAVARFE